MPEAPVGDRTDERRTPAVRPQAAARPPRALRAGDRRARISARSSRARDRRAGRADAAPLPARARPRRLSWAARPEGRRAPLGRGDDLCGERLCIRRVVPAAVARLRRGPAAVQGAELQSDRLRPGAAQSERPSRRADPDQARAAPRWPVHGGAARRPCAHRAPPGADRSRGRSARWREPARRPVRRRQGIWGAAPARRLRAPGGRRRDLDRALRLPPRADARGARAWRRQRAHGAKPGAALAQDIGARRGDLSRAPQHAGWPGERHVRDRLSQRMGTRREPAEAAQARKRRAASRRCARHHGTAGRRQGVVPFQAKSLAKNVLKLLEHAADRAADLAEQRHDGDADEHHDPIFDGRGP